MTLNFYLVHDLDLGFSNSDENNSISGNTSDITLAHGRIFFILYVLNEAVLAAPGVALETYSFLLWQSSWCR